MDIEETVVRETHKAAGHGRYGHGELWAGQVVKLAGVASNHGVKSRRGVADRRPTKLDVLDDAICKFPHLVRKIHGQVRLGRQNWRYRFRPVDAPLMDNVLLKHASGNAAMVCDVFGSWDLWPSGWEDNGAAQGEYADRDEEERHSEQWAQDTVRIREYDDLNSLSGYHRTGVDRRQEQLSAFIRLLEESGGILEDGRIVLLQAYSK